MIQLINGNNLDFTTDNIQADLIYSDCIYESKDLGYLKKYWDLLKVGGIYIVQTDFHTVFEYGMELKNLSNSNFVSHSVWKCEWGNYPKNTFHQCFDDILIFSKGKNYKFYPDRVQVPKATLTKGLNPSGRTTKQATAWIDDITLTTTAKERISLDGHLIRWQKPLKLFDRIIKPFTDDEELIIDNFMGSGSLGEWCVNNKRSYIGIENNETIFSIAEKRINWALTSQHQQ